MNWRLNLENIPILFNEGREKGFVSASDISTYIYHNRDKKTFLNKINAPLTIEEKTRVDMGTVFHEKQSADSTKINLKEVIFGIENGIQLSEFLLIAKINGIILGGRVDKITFIDSMPFVLEDYKRCQCIKNVELPLFPSTEFQMYTYVFLLRQIGFNTSHLKIRVIKSFENKENIFDVKIDEKKISEIASLVPLVFALTHNNNDQ